MSTSNSFACHCLCSSAPRSGQRWASAWVLHTDQPTCPIYLAAVPAEIPQHAPHVACMHACITPAIQSLCAAAFVGYRLPHATGAYSQPHVITPAAAATLAQTCATCITSDAADKRVLAQLGAKPAAIITDVALWATRQLVPQGRHPSSPGSSSISRGVHDVVCPAHLQGHI